MFPREYSDYTSAITVGLLHKDALGLLSLQKPASHMQIELPPAPTDLKAEATPLTFDYDGDSKQVHCDMPKRETTGRVHKVDTVETSINGETIVTPHPLTTPVERPFTVCDRLTTKPEVTRSLRDAD